MSQVQFYRAYVVRRTCRARLATSQPSRLKRRANRTGGWPSEDCQQAGGNDEIQRCFLCERLSAQSLCKQKLKTSGPGIAAMPPRIPPKNPNVMPVGKTKRD